MRTDQHQQEIAFVDRSSFPRLPAAVGAARDWVTSAFARAGGTEEQAFTCALLVGELATNAVQHASGERFEVTVWSSGAVDVKDGSFTKPEPRSSGEEDENGRGLQLVVGLSRRVELIPLSDGKIVRFWL
ncbi:ATP-binding protein [Streptomyces mayonensis]|uniref:ATP-binding protein n=1 Tax=Streptomyces mayonensis TaxID=2750816 RepID=UPI001C1DD498|nr:ATP-binding protein [Streptomyces sp. A108]MBU6534648.1 ATP-binding protein [Streptomyces sp. A108]